MHNPRGSNNRLKEQSANRQNANRLFDSQVTDFGVKDFSPCMIICSFRQNNNRGGYNVGEVSDQNNGVNQESDIYNMVRIHRIVRSLVVKVDPFVGEPSLDFVRASLLHAR